MRNHSYDHVVSFALDHPWAITRPMLGLIAGILAHRIAGEDVDQATIEAALVSRKNLPQPRRGSVAIIPVYGVLAPRMNLFSEMSGGTTFEKLTGQLHEAMGNQTVRTIVLDVDSPGGNVAGATEFANELLRARTKKPIIGQIQFTGASAAYWPIACCTEVVAAPSARVGSLGVYTSHDDLSEALAKLGIKRTYLSAGKGKVDGNEAEPLGEETAARISKILADAYGLMVGDVVKGRARANDQAPALTAGRVRDEWKALLYTSSEALANGMIDRIATLDETVARLLGASPDANDQALAQTIPLPAGDTFQEPSRATNQDRRAEVELERAVLELSL